MQPSDTQLAPEPVVTRTPTRIHPTPELENPTLRGGHSGWLIVSHTLPALMILGIYWSAYGLVGSILAGDTLERWKTGAVVLGIVHGGFLIHAIQLWRQRRPVPVTTALISMVVHTFVSMYVLFSMPQLMPRSVPQWMFPSELFRLSMALPLIPALHSMYLLALASIKRDDHMLRSIMTVVLIPAAWFLIMSVLAGFGSRSMSKGLLLVGGALFMAALLFHLVKLSLQLARRTSGRFNDRELIWRIPMGLVLPLTGLIVHAGHGMDGRGPLGDFSHPLFYILAILNGVTLCLPAPRTRDLSLLMFFFRGVGLVYVLYFTLVFLPYLPIAVFMILLFGLGLLIWLPLALFVFQLKDLWNEAMRLEKIGIGPVKWVCLAAGIMIIPALMEFHFQRDAKVLEQALIHVHAPDVRSTVVPPSASAVERVTRAARRHKNSTTREFDINGIPFISPWYERIVFKELTLSDAKISMLEQVFLGKASDLTNVRRGRTSSPPLGSVKLNSMQAQNEYDAATNTWSAWVDLELVNGPTAMAEYATAFTLPPGAYIRDHYLMIGERYAEGILAEHRAASWIYRQITTITRQDPSLLRYIAPGMLEFRVFPFSASETRTTGFQIITPEPFELVIDDVSVLIGEPMFNAYAGPVFVEDPQAVHFTTRAKAALPLVTPDVSLWCIIDRSVNSTGSDDELIGLLESTLTSIPAGPAVHFILAGTSAKEVTQWQDAVRSTSTTGGLFLDHAVDIVIDHHEEHRSEVPLILVVTSHPEAIIQTHRVPQALAAYGIQNRIMVLDLSDENSTETLNELLRSTAMRRWPAEGPIQALLPDDGRPSTVLLDDAGSDGSNGTGDWVEGLQLHARASKHSVEPHLLLNDENSDARMSIAAGILTPATAYICLETEAQEVALMRKQEQMLKGSPLMDAGEELRSMSEPGDLFLLLALIAFLGVGALRAWRAG